MSGENPPTESAPMKDPFEQGVDIITNYHTGEKYFPGKSIILIHQVFETERTVEKKRQKFPSRWAKFLTNAALCFTSDVQEKLCRNVVKRPAGNHFFHTYAHLQILGAVDDLLDAAKKYPDSLFFVGRDENYQFELRHGNIAGLVPERLKVRVRDEMDDWVRSTNKIYEFKGRRRVLDIIDRYLNGKAEFTGAEILAIVIGHVELDHADLWLEWIAAKFLFNACLPFSDQDTAKELITDTSKSDSASYVEDKATRMHRALRSSGAYKDMMRDIDTYPYRLFEVTYGDDYWHRKQTKEEKGATGGRLESMVANIDTRLEHLQGTVDRIASELRDLTRTINTLRLKSFIDNISLQATGAVDAPREESDTAKKRKLGEGPGSSVGAPRRRLRRSRVYSQPLQAPAASNLSDEEPSDRHRPSYPPRPT